MAKTTDAARKKLIDALNGDLSREYQAIIAYVNYSQVLKGAEYMNIAAELEVHAAEELAHCAEDFPADRLPGRHADRCPRAGKDIQGRSQNAAVRFGQRDQDDRQLPGADS